MPINGFPSAGGWEVNGADGTDGLISEARGRSSGRLNQEQLATLLADRETKLQTREIEGIADQWRVYCHIVEALSSDKPAKLMVQASAGTGKSFLLTTVFLWCIVHGKKTRAAAPTGQGATKKTLFF